MSQLGLAVRSVSHQSPQYGPVEDLPALRQGDQGFSADLQREDGPGLRLRTGQDGSRHSEPRHLVGLHQVLKRSGCRWKLCREPKDHGYQKGARPFRDQTSWHWCVLGVPESSNQPHDEYRGPVEGVHLI